MSKGAILLCAGGTGGHLFPAEALAHELRRRGFEIHLATDERADRFAGDFPAVSKRIIRSATMSSKNPVALLKMFWTLAGGYRESGAYIREINPKAVVGFGGYPTLPPLMAASSAKLPTLVHEQNAVLGRANRMLAKRVSGVAVGFKQVGVVPSVPLVETGNPVRPMVEAVRDVPYPARQPSDPLRLVVFGGSQGARFFSEALPPALKMLDSKERELFSILQQAREEDEAALRSAYADLGVDAEIAPFVKNMPEEISKAHFVIARAGASSVTELAVIGRPSLLVPFPGSLDGDQAANAIAMAEAHGAHIIKQAELDTGRLAGILRTAINEPNAMAEMAQSARQTGIADAAQRLADCVECVISGGDITSLTF
jgi:UDP-N-acetylglucosamine--N-acetylmuramyl-(pentapeptide) pyrophosphoryl-undecaprenol N-acetylglucosamine transferase